MTKVAERNPDGMRQDPSFRLGYEFPEMLDAILDLAASSPSTTRVERFSSSGTDLVDAVSHVPLMFGYSIPRELPLIQALIGMAQDLHMAVNLRLYDRVQDTVHDLWDSAKAPVGTTPDMSDAEAGWPAQQVDLYLDIASPRTRDSRALHVRLG